MNSVKNEERIEPYILLFPTGCLLGLLGLVFWIFFQLGWIQFYPRALHGNLMFFGFLWSFVAGFLMTAVPKMTSTSAAHIGEISFAVALVFIQMVLNVRNLTDISVFVFLMQNAFLLFFVVRRFLVNRKVPFFGFIFLPMAFIQSVLGVALYFFYSDRSLFVLLSGEAFILNLILGLGSRLIPVISRLPNALLPNESSSSDSLTWPLVVLLLVNAGYWCEIFNLRELGVVLRIFGILIAAVKLLRLFVVPVTWSYVGVGLKISVVMLAIGQIFSLSFFYCFLRSFFLRLLLLFISTDDAIMSKRKLDTSPTTITPKKYIINRFTTAINYKDLNELINHFIDFDIRVRPKSVRNWYI